MSFIPSPEDDAHVARQQAEYVEEQAEEAERSKHASLPLAVDEAALRQRGVAFAHDMTSPGGPWHGLSEDQILSDENKRWAAVEMASNHSAFLVTADHSSNVGENAENVVGYILPSDSGRVLLRNATLETATQIGNDIAYRGGYTDYVA